MVFENIPTKLWLWGVGIIIFFLVYPIIFRKKILENLKRTAAKSELSWTDKSGKVHTEEVIFKKSKMPLVGDWGRIYPPVDEDGKINYVNLIFGGKKNFIRVLIIMLLILAVFWWVNGVIGLGSEYLDGNKYVIMDKEVFGTFCQTSIFTQTNVTSLGNLTVFTGLET